MVRSAVVPEPQHLRLDRSTALAVALVLNLGVLGGLTLPSNQPFQFPAPTAEQPTIIAELLSKPVEPPPPAPPLPTPPRPPTPQPVAMQPAPITAPTVTPAPSPVATAHSNEAAVSDAIPRESTATVTPSPAPTAEITVTYRFAPAPPYPGIAHRRRQEGLVMLRVLVASNGVAREVQVERSSGFDELDHAARNQVLKRWEFVPASIDGRNVDAWVRVPIEFKLYGAN